MYTKALEAFLIGQINWETDVIKAVLIDTAFYTPNFTTDAVLDDIPLNARIVESPALTAKTGANGVADAADVTFPGLVGAQCEALVLFKQTLNSSTNRLICFIDTAGGLPIIPDGNDITVVWDNGANKIFRL
jgi:hypothetical protein